MGKDPRERVIKILESLKNKRKRFSERELKGLENFIKRGKLPLDFEYADRRRIDWILQFLEKGEPEYKDQGAVHVFCEEAGIDQDHMLEDVGGLIASVPELISFYQSEKKQEVIRLRVSSEEKAQMLKLASERGYKSLSSYLRNRAFA